MCCLVEEGASGVGGEVEGHRAEDGKTGLVCLYSLQDMSWRH